MVEKVPVGAQGFNATRSVITAGPYAGNSTVDSPSTPYRPTVMQASEERRGRYEGKGCEDESGRLRKYTYR